MTNCPFCDKELTKSLKFYNSIDCKDCKFVKDFYISQYVIDYFVIVIEDGFFIVNNGYYPRVRIYHNHKVIFTSNSLVLNKENILSICEKALKLYKLRAFQ
jgi:hypothetical protein